MSEKTLSVFVDESGILNESDASSRYYIVSFVLHNQAFDVSDAISSLDQDLASIGIVNLCFHAAPIIRGNGAFGILSAELRRKIFSRMMGFVRKVDFKYHCLCIDKHYCDTAGQMESKLEQQMRDFIAATKPITDGFGRVKVYYDCGQKFITHLLHHGFEELKIPEVEFAQSVKPHRYKLFQVADLICTLRPLADCLRLLPRPCLPSHGAPPSGEAGRGTNRGRLPIVSTPAPILPASRSYAQRRSGE